MSNSPLVNYVKLSPNYDSRDGHKITDITIHHMAGNLTVEQCGAVFQNYGRSSNYGIDSKGRVGMYVQEAYTSWANSNFASNQRSITIELANDRIGGNWHVSDTAINKCIELCVDICRRNGIKRLNFTGNTNGNLTAHRMFTSTACPGDYLYSKFPYIQNEVNRQLGQGDGKLIVDGLFGELSTMKLQKMLGIVEDEEEGARDGPGTGQGQRRKSQGRRRRLKAGKPYLGLAGEQTLAEGFELRMSGVERLERVNIHKNRAQKY